MSEQNVSWSTFHSVVSGLVALMCVVLGAGFAWMHSDIGDIRGDINIIRTVIAGVEQRTNQGKEDVQLQISKLSERTATLEAGSKRNN